MTEAQQSYYQSHHKLSFIGEVGQLKLSAAKVLVIGAGGLGCPCLQTLAGCGIGTIGIADFDTVSISNLHRQTLYNFGDEGKPKVAIAKTKLQLLNPYIHIIDHDVQVNETNVLELLAAYDVIVDGTDNFAVRYLVNDACVYLDKPLVYGAIYQCEGHVTVFNYQNSATLRCLFPEPNAETYVPSCAEVGAYNVVTAIIGNMMANETVKVILQLKEVIANKLATYDALSVEMRTIGYKNNVQSRITSLARFKNQNKTIEISPEEFLALSPDSYHLIDVREDWERDEHHIGGDHVPLNALSRHNFSALAKNQQLIFYCAAGARSASAAQWLRQQGYANAYSLKGGITDRKNQ